MGQLVRSNQSPMHLVSSYRRPRDQTEPHVATCRPPSSRSQTQRHPCTSVYYPRYHSTGTNTMFNWSRTLRPSLSTSLELYRPRGLTSVRLTTLCFLNSMLTHPRSAYFISNNQSSVVSSYTSGIGTSSCPSTGTKSKSSSTPSATQGPNGPSDTSNANSDQDGSPASHTNVGAIAGGVVAAVVAIAALIVLILFIRRRNQSQAPPLSTTDYSRKDSPPQPDTPISRRSSAYFGFPEVYSSDSVMSPQSERSTTLYGLAPTSEFVDRPLYPSRAATARAE